MHQGAGTVKDGKKVGGQFATQLHGADESIVLGTPAPAAASRASGGPLRTIPEALLMSYDGENEVRNELVGIADFRIRATEDCFRSFNNRAEGDIDGQERRRLFDDAVQFARNGDYDSMEAAVAEASAYAGDRRGLVAGHLETAVLAASVAHEDGAQDYAKRSFMQSLEFLDRADAEDEWEKVLHALDTGGDVDKACAEAARRNTEAHPGGTLQNGYRPPSVKREAGYGQGTLQTGSRYEARYMDATEVAANVRQELKAAQEGNYLPAGLSFSVTREKFSGGQAVRVSIRGLTDADRLDPVETNHWGDPKDRAEARELNRRVEAITNAWNRQDTDSSTDYFNVSYYGTVDIETDSSRDFREREAAARKAAKASRMGRAV